MEIIVFYSWISEYDNWNKQFIRRCINAAIQKLRKKKLSDLYGVEIKLTESLGLTPGHQRLTTTQENQIVNSDIFIGDWTVIDPYSRFENFRAKHFGYSRRRNINSNVIHEYDCFIGANGVDGAILIMDATRGSAKQDNDIIPIDLRDRRFPIEFSGENDEKDLINDIYHALKLSIPSVLKQRKNRYSPLHTWYEQNDLQSLNRPFYANPYLTSLISRIKTSKTDIRIIGMSGIGKTRIVHETYRGEPDSFYRNNYLYVQYSIDESSIIRKALISHIQNPNDCSLLVIDNCPPDFARTIQQDKHDFCAQNKIITLFNRQDLDSTNRVEGIEYYNIKLDDVASVVDDILNGIYSDLSDDKKAIIRNFAAGLPMMAVILAENIKNGNVNFTKIQNYELVERLLDTGDSQEKEILMSCAIFAHIGYRNEVASQVKFIICNKNINPFLSGEECAKMSLFERIFTKYTTREIFETQGRFFAIRPMPLALRLYEEWLLGCNAERMLHILNDIQTEDKRQNSQMLTSAFADQIAYLAGNPKAKDIISVITGNSSPFACAEVLNTELGSRLFLSFVEITPTYVADLLWRVFGDMSYEDLYNIHNGRRNLVLTIQKLCFDKRTFTTGTKLLIKFAIAENETWGNNATNEALNLFHIYLPGTEANLNQRIEIIQWLRTLNNTKKLLDNILSAALTCSNYSYMCGAEIQGPTKLKHYVPTGKEILTYWKDIIYIIKEIVEKDSCRLNDMSKIVADNFCGLVKAGAESIAFEIAEYIANIRQNDWDELVEKIRPLFWIDSSKEMSDGLVSKLHNLINRLVKNDFIPRLKNIEHIDGKAWDVVENIRNSSYITMAIEFAEKEYASLQLLTDILNDSTINPNAIFGTEIYKQISNNKILFNQLTSQLISILSLKKDYTNNILIGFLSKASEEDFDYAYRLLYNTFPEALFPLLAIRKENLSNCTVLLKLVENNPTLIDAIDTFCLYYEWSSTCPQDILSFFNQLARLSEQGAKIAINRMYQLIHFNDKKHNYSFLLDAYCDFITTEIYPVCINNEEYLKNIHLAINNYESPKVASFINKYLISYFFTDSSSMLNYGYYLECVLSVLFDKYFDIVWPDWSIKLTDSENISTVILLKYKLGHSIGGPTNGALFGVNHNDALMQWCRDYPTSAPIILAMYIPMYDGNSLSELAKFLLDNYGNNKKVLTEISCNLGSFTCVGSAIPIFQKKIDALKELTPHSNPIVNHWLIDQIKYAENAINKERDRDAEEAFLYR